MLKRFKRISITMLAALALVAGLFVASASPAMAETSPNGYCPGSSPSQISWASFPWHTASWGRVKVCNYSDQATWGLEFLTEDTLTDGYCVHVDILDGIWEGTDSITVDGGTSTTSCGTQVYGWTHDSYPGEIMSARLIRGTGTPGIGVNYMTIYTHP